MAPNNALTESREVFVDSILSGQPEPPFYFARMKRDNRDGQALLPDGKLPQPKEMAAAELMDFVADEKNVVLDLRTDKLGFMAKQVKGALWAPLRGTEFPELARHLW